MVFRHKKAEAEAKAAENFKKNWTRVYVATPAYDGRVLTDYAMSLAESCLLAPMYGIHVTAGVIGNGAFIDLARNTLVRMFLETECTHLFFIDADLRWEARAFIGLLQANLPICAGAYPKRQEPEEYPVTFAKSPEDGGIWVTAEGDPASGYAMNGWVQCERVATGFLCIRRDVIENMVKHAPTQKVLNQPEQPMLFSAMSFKREDGKYTPAGDLIKGEWTPERSLDFLGEDYFFCDRYRHLTGNTIPVWPDFDFTHGSRWKGNWHQFLLKQSEEETKRIEAEKNDLSKAA